jgi:hypothetical protein
MIPVDSCTHPALLSAQASLYMLATASNVPSEQLKASDLDVLVAIHHVLNDDMLPVEKKLQCYESLHGGKTHDWLDVCNHPHAWSILHELSQSHVFIGDNAHSWHLEDFARGWSDFPLNVSGVSCEHICLYFFDVSHSRLHWHSCDLLRRCMMLIPQAKSGQNVLMNMNPGWSQQAGQHGYGQ